MEKQWRALRFGRWQLAPVHNARSPFHLARGSISNGGRTVAVHQPSCGPL